MGSIEDEPTTFGNSSVPRTERTNLHVRGLTPRVTGGTLQSWFEPFGVIKSCAVMTNPKTGESRNYGFVRFETEAQAHRALSELSGKQLEIPATNGAGAAGAADVEMVTLSIEVSEHNGTAAGEESKYIFVRNLPSWAAETEIWTWLSRFGKVRYLNVEAIRPARRSKRGGGRSSIQPQSQQNQQSLADSQQHHLLPGGSSSVALRTDPSASIGKSVEAGASPAQQHQQQQEPPQLQRANVEFSTVDEARGAIRAIMEPESVPFPMPEGRLREEGGDADRGLSSAPPARIIAKFADSEQSKSLRERRNQARKVQREQQQRAVADALRLVDSSATSSQGDGAASQARTSPSVARSGGAQGAAASVREPTPPPPLSGPQHTASYPTAAASGGPVSPALQPAPSTTTTTSNLNGWLVNSGAPPPPGTVMPSPAHSAQHPHQPPPPPPQQQQRAAIPPPPPGQLVHYTGTLVSMGDGTWAMAEPETLNYLPSPKPQRLLGASAAAAAAAGSASQTTAAPTSLAPTVSHPDPGTVMLAGGPDGLPPPLQQQQQRPQPPPQAVSIGGSVNHHHVFLAETYQTTTVGDSFVAGTDRAVWADSAPASPCVPKDDALET